jgi:hypothetical protein
MSPATQTWKRFRAVLAAFSHRLAYALLFGIVTWLFAWLPTPFEANQFFGWALAILNAPVAFVSIRLPVGWQAIDLVFGSILPHTYTSSDFLWRHLRTAVPVYLFLFWLPSLVRSLWRRRLRRDSTLPAQTSEAPSEFGE